jgi:hypothetical protein
MGSYSILKVFLNLAGKSLFYLGVCLLIINIIGLFISLRNESIYQDQNTQFENDIILTEKEMFNQINQEVIDKKDYITNLNATVNQGIAHYWRDSGINTYNLRVPVYKNYLLFIASYLDPEEYLKYEFVDYKKAIERGIGLCSQQAIIVSEILLEKSIPSFIIGLTGHVVLRAQVDASSDEWWVLDPDYGVIIPYDINVIEKDSKIIRPFYARAGYKLETIDMLEKIYKKKGNVISSKPGARGYQSKRCRNEPRFYLFKWIIPFILMIPSIMVFSVKTKNRTR